MSGTGPADDDRGTLAEFEHVVERCDRYEAAWREGRRPRIEDYLAEALEPERAALLLRELLALELELRSSGGERPEPQEYRERFPGHVELINRILNEAGPSAPHDQQRQLNPIKSGGNPLLRKNFRADIREGNRQGRLARGRRLRHLGGVGPRWHGGGLPGPAATVEAFGRPEDDPGRPPGQAEGLGPFPARGGSGRAVASRQYRADLRHRRRSPASPLSRWNCWRGAASPTGWPAHPSRDARRRN